MLRKSLLILTWCAVLATAAIAIFALGFARPDDSLRDAERLLAKGDRTRAVSLLDRIADDLKGDRVLYERLLRLRLRALTGLGNDEAAAKDAERLSRLLPDDDEVRLQYIDLQSRTGDLRVPRRELQQFLADRPDHAPALQLAGGLQLRSLESAVTAFWRELAPDVPPRDLAATRALVDDCIYRSADDARCQSARQSLAALHERDPRLQPAWPSRDTTLATLRDEAAAAAGWFRRCLEIDGDADAAFEGLARLLDRGGRRDDLLLLCEIRRRRVADQRGDAAGAFATRALLRSGHPAAALRAAERWLPNGTTTRRIGDKAVTPALLELLANFGWAAHLAATPAALDRAWAEISAFDRWRPTPLAFLLGLATNQPRWDWKQVPDRCSWLLRELPRAPAPDALDLVPGTAALWLQSLDVIAADDEQVQTCLREWSARRPDAVEPLLVAAERTQRAGLLAASVAKLAEALQLAPDDEAVFQRYLQAQRRLVAGTDRDGESLVAQCLRQRRTRPDSRDPLGYLLCGEAALTRGLLPIAHACAVAAKDAFPNARATRLLLAKVYRANGYAEDAAREIDGLLQLLPPDPDGLELALACHADSPPQVDALLARAMTTSGRSEAIDVALLERSLAATTDDAPAFVTPAMTAADARPQLRLLAARAAAVAGDAGRADALLAQALAAAPPARPLDIARALVAWLAAAAPRTADAELEAAATRHLQAAGALDGPGGSLLVACARQLAATHGKTALLLASTGVASPDPEERRGVDYVLVGDLAARAGRWRLAEDSWTAALAFSDGTTCAENLARLCLALGRPERAAQVLTVLDTVQDPALAVRFEQFERAAACVGDLLRADRADLLSHAALSLVGPAFYVDWTPVEGSEQKARAELLAILRNDALAPLAQTRLLELVAANPRSRTSRLLLARAQAAAGLGAAAAALHATLDQEGLADPAFYREVAVAAAMPGYEVPPALERKVMLAAVQNGIDESPTTSHFAAAASERQLRAQGRTNEADAIRRLAWQAEPQRLRLDAEALQFVTTQLPPGAAWTVIERALPAASADQRGPAIDRLFAVGRTLAAMQPTALPQLVAAAHTYRERDGARAAIVDFLLDVADPPGAATLTTEQRVELCRQHLTAVATGRDAATTATATIDRLLAMQGEAATAAELDRLLQQHPTSLALWRARLRFSPAAADLARAVADARALLEHANAPALALDVLALAAETGQLHDSDAAALAALPAALRDGPLGVYVAGVQALRGGRLDEALLHLADPPARPHGVQLQLRALACLQGTAADAVATARTCLETLQRDHPSSSLARYAGSFASQLALP